MPPVKRFLWKKLRLQREDIGALWDYYLVRRDQH